MTCPSHSLTLADGRTIGPGAIDDFEQRVKDQRVRLLDPRRVAVADDDLKIGKSPGQNLKCFFEKKGEIGFFVQGRDDQC